MTGKLVEKTMSSLLNTLQDAIYPEDEIVSAAPTSMNIFNSDAGGAYGQMSAGKTLDSPRAPGLADLLVSLGAVEKVDIQRVF
ncbi:hypothetical protein chiPu_0023589 [Chiloscyllium punctatum]|uniref:Uncharacterized protein n=1 Tax=Chiloscyllium punctatum TaxID=137246 RepID=A0A401TBD8_CHIPU|nr:hypothetical protein [Chiloscyllium punctatum]